MALHHHSDTERRAIMRRMSRAHLERARKRAKPGAGTRFAAVEEQVRRSGARDPAAVAAAIGRRKYGKSRFQRMAAAGRRRAG